MEGMANFRIHLYHTFRQSSVDTMPRERSWVGHKREGKKEVHFKKIGHTRPKGE